MVKNLPAMQETWVWSLGQEDPLEKEMATHNSIIAWRIPWTEEPGGLYIPCSHKKESDNLATKQQQLYDLQKVHFLSSSYCLWLVHYSVPTYLPIFGGTLKHVFLYTMTWRNFEYSSNFFLERITSHLYIRSFYHHMALVFSWVFPTDCYCTLWQQPYLWRLAKNTESSMLRRQLKPTENIMGIPSLIS